MIYEYKVVAAPERPGRGRRGRGAGVAEALGAVIAEEAVAGWEYVSVETLPVTERRGWLSPPVETEHAVVVFRRLLPPDRAAEAPEPARGLGGAFD